MGCWPPAPRPLADRHFQHLAQHSAGGRHFDIARTQLLYGEALRRRNRQAEARRHLRTALEAFERLGAVPCAEQARAELRPAARPPALDPGCDRP